MMHEKARERMKRQVLSAKPVDRDFYLDQYLDCRDRATEWDAFKWLLTGSEVDKAAEAFDRWWRDRGSELLWPSDIVPVPGEPVRRP